MWFSANIQTQLTHGARTAYVKRNRPRRGPRVQSVDKIFASEHDGVGWEKVNWTLSRWIFRFTFFVETGLTVVFRAFSISPSHCGVVTLKRATRNRWTRRPCTNKSKIRESHIEQQQHFMQLTMLLLHASILAVCSSAWLLHLCMSNFDRYSNDITRFYVQCTLKVLNIKLVQLLTSRLLFSPFLSPHPTKHRLPPHLKIAHC